MQSTRRPACATILDHGFQLRSQELESRLEGCGGPYGPDLGRAADSVSPLAVFGFGQGLDPKRSPKTFRPWSWGSGSSPHPFGFGLSISFPASPMSPLAGATKLTLDEFKHGQDQSSKIWLALVALLFGLYFGKDFIHDTRPAPANTSVTCVCPQGSQPAPLPPQSVAPSSSPASPHPPKPRAHKNR